MPAAQKSQAAAAPKAAAPAAKSLNKPLKKGDHVFLVDGSGYIFRAYHALPPINRKSDGLQLNAVFGFCNMLWKLLRDMKEDKPTHLAVVFDKSEKTFRTAMYPDYKAHRPDPPDDLRPQFKFIREAVHAFDLPCLEQDGFEADDLIATYVRQASEAGATSTIVSSDKDLMQLVTDGVIMFDTMKDKKIGRAEVMEKFGVPPDKVIEVQALIGDSTDNVPGVPGIGVKTAAQLIGEYGDLETLLQRAPEIKQDKRRQSLIDNAEKARLSKKLVTLDDQVKLNVPIGDLAVHEPDYKRLIAFLKAMEFNALMRRVAEYSGAEAGEIEAEARFAGHIPSAPSSSAAEIASPDKRAGAGDKCGAAAPPRPAGAAGRSRPEARQRRACEFLRQRRRHLPPREWRPRAPRSSTARNTRRSAAWNGSTPGSSARARSAWSRLTSRPRALIRCRRNCAAWRSRSLPTRPAMCRSVIVRAAKARASSAATWRPIRFQKTSALDALKPLLEDMGVLKIGHDLKFAWQLFALRGIEIAAYDDTMLMSYALDAGRASHALDSVAERTFNHAAIDINELIKAGKTKITFDAVGIDRATEYAAEKADIVLRLHRVLKPRLAAERVLTVYETLERPLLAVLARMERRGISIDRDVLSRLSGEFAQEAAGLEDEINREAGETVNPGSPKQLGDILFGKLGLPGGTKTKTGQWATGARALEELAEQGHKLPQMILNWRQVSKLKSTYTDALPGFRQSDDASGAHQVCAGVDHDRSAVVVRSESAEHSGSDRGRPKNPPRFHCRARDQARLRRLFADRAATARRNRRHRAAAKGVSRGPRHPRHDGERNVRRADQRHAARNTPPRQGDQFRHRLWHLRFRARQSARHRPRRSRRLHQEIFRALSRHPRLHRRIEDLRQAEWLRAHAVRPQMSLPGNPRVQCVGPFLQRTRRRQRAAARQRRRHHPPRHDPHGRRAGEEEAVGANAAAGAR